MRRKGMRCARCRSRAEAELFQHVGQQRPPRRAGMGEHHMVENLCGPAQIAVVEATLAFATTRPRRP